MKPSQEPPPTKQPAQWPKKFITVLVLYSAWVAWLAYVAWVNVQAGNQ